MIMKVALIAFKDGNKAAMVTGGGLDEYRGRGQEIEDAVISLGGNSYFYVEKVPTGWEHYLHGDGCITLS